jgi:putative serine/threonine protein kinase
LKKNASVVLTEKLNEEPYASIICYPKAAEGELSRRLTELQELGIEALEFRGEKAALNIPVLGKGCVGIVTIAYKNKRKVALKIRRTDADRATMRQEVEALRKANSVDVGPHVLGSSRNFLLMQLVKGFLLPEWLETHNGKTLMRTILCELMEQCWRLDNAGLDHGELSRAPKHVIIDKSNKPVIVDFETASFNRRSSNVTSICHFLFLSGSVAKKVRQCLGEKEEQAIMRSLKLYKKERTRSNFENVLEACGF